MNDPNGDIETRPQILTRDDGATIAYHKTPGRPPGVVFLGGFASDMTGTKATALEAFCRARGQAYLRFDYRGHGASSGAFTDGTIGGWSADALSVLDALVEGPQVLVGSSLGGWIMLLVARARPERIAGLIGVAAAPDFTRELVERGFTAEQRDALERDGVVYLPSDYGDEPYPITRRLIEEGREHLVLQSPIQITCPVRLLHGMKDTDVPCERALRISEMLVSTDVEVILVKDGGHRLSEPQDLERLCRTVAEVVERASDRSA